MTRKFLIICQNDHGFLLEKYEGSIPDFATGSIDKLIPAVNLTKPYNDYSGKSVLEQVEAFFAEPPAEKT
jgi:hypothetical protein